MLKDKVGVTEIRLLYVIIKLKLVGQSGEEATFVLGHHSNRVCRVVPPVLSCLLLRRTDCGWVDFCCWHAHGIHILPSSHACSSTCSLLAAASFCK
jgi:hypothetical protein